MACGQISMSTDKCYVRVFFGLSQAEKKPEPAAEDEPPAEKKSKDPFAHLPPSSMVMDDWKKMYSNNELSVSMPYFWEHFNKETMSIWKCEYLYEDELKLTFMSANLIAGQIIVINSHSGCVLTLFGCN